MCQECPTNTEAIQAADRTTCRKILYFLKPGAPVVTGEEEPLFTLKSNVIVINDYIQIVDF